MPMITRELTSDWRACVLSALAPVALDQNRLFQSVCRHSRIQSPFARGKDATKFFDALALLQADGLISEKPHALPELRRYYLTEKGHEIAMGLRFHTRQRAR
jgi:hypothetical protein